MKAKEVEIRIESLEEATSNAVKTAEGISTGKKIKPRKVIAFEDLATLRRIITDERIRLLKLIRKEEPKSILSLAKIAKRKYANVFNDVKTLEELGLIELGKENHALEPKANYQKLKIEIPV